MAAPVKKGQEIDVEILDMAFGGVGLARIPTAEGNFSVFVQNAIPGQRVLARVTEVKKRYAECNLKAVITPSPREVEIPYHRIPGAPYATVPPALQQEWKERTTLEVYRRIGEMPWIDKVYDGYIPSPAQWHYRNKMEYSFSAIGFDPTTGSDVDRFSLGFKARGTWWMVENLEGDSGLFDRAWEELLPEIRRYCANTGLPAWHAPSRKGFFRFLVVRKSVAEDKLLVNLVTHEDPRFDPAQFAAFLYQHLGARLAGVIHTLNTDEGERAVPLSGSATTVFGSDHVVETIAGLGFRISMTSFFQTNPACAALLYAKTLEYVRAAPQPDNGVVLDLFCGTGTIAQLLAAGGVREVVGVDIVESAIADARINAEQNGWARVRFIAADAGAFLKENPGFRGRIACVVLDPPRGGIAPKTLQKVIALEAPRIVYVSCNPATQARDALALRDAGYSLKKLSLVDQFPHTAHVEAIGCWEK